MSSPIAKEQKTIFDKLLIKYHKQASHGNRVEQLSALLSDIIFSLGKKGTIRLLDVGCGDMSITKTIASKIENLQYTCIDIYPNSEEWDNYVEFDGKNIPFSSDEFDIVLFCDMLHHDFENVDNLFSEAKRVGSYIIVKDHFEYGFLSRKVLQLADFIGNYGYGVSIPKRYFSIDTFGLLLKKQKLKEVMRYCPVQLYAKSTLAKMLFKSKYQFISLIEK